MKMLRLKDFEFLPEAMDQKEIEEKFEFVLSAALQDQDPDLVIMCLGELTDRQANNFSLLEENIRVRVSDYLKANWDESSLENTEMCLHIVINLGLQALYEYMLDKLPEIKSKDVYGEIQDCISDVGFDISDISGGK